MARITGCCGFNLKNSVIAIGATLLTFYIVTLEIFFGFTIYYAVEYHQLYVWQIVLCGVSMSIHLTFNSLLVHGARRGVRALLVCWLVYFGINMALSALPVGYLLFVGSEAAFSARGSGNAVVTGCVVGVLLLGVMAYWFSVVLSYSRELRKQPAVPYQAQVDEVETPTVWFTEGSRAPAGPLDKKC